jgi:hypothetical protein
MAGSRVKGKETFKYDKIRGCASPAERLSPAAELVIHAFTQFGFLHTPVRVKVSPAFGFRTVKTGQIRTK